jgi:hypothetical protein
MDDEKSYLFPPSLDGVGTKVRPDWLHSFIKQPGDNIYRYWLQSRMPTYSLSDIQLNSLIQYFALRDKQPFPFESDTLGQPVPASPELIEAGRKIVEEGKCMLCHQPRTMAEAAEAPNTAVNLSEVKRRMRPKGLDDWLANPAKITPGVNMPNFWNEGQPSPLLHLLEGDNQKQIEAVSAYLQIYNASAGSSATTSKK